MSEPRHFNLTGRMGGGLSPSQLLNAIENGESVEPVEATTNLAYVGGQPQDTPEDNDEDATPEVRPTPVSEEMSVGGNEPIQIGTTKKIENVEQLSGMNTGMTVETACAIVYKCLPVPNQKAIDDVMVNIKLSLPQFILGILNAAYAAGNYSSPLLDPAWATADSNYLISDSECKECGKTFTPKWRGQLYCMNMCGMLNAERELIAKRNAAKLARQAENAQRTRMMENF